MTVTLTLEALYALHLMNEHSEDLTFLPLPRLKEGETRKEQLRSVLKKGYGDLQEVGFLNGQEPTDDFVRYGYYLESYADNYYHFQVDSNYFCAPEVDKYERMSVVIKKVGENAYVMEYLNTIAFLSILLSNHDLLHHLDDKFKNYLKSEWEPYAYLRLLAYYGEAKTIRLKTEQLGRIWADHLFFNTENGLFEYNLLKQMIRSISVKEMKHMLIKQMKVKV